MRKQRAASGGRFVRRVALVGAVGALGACVAALGGCHRAPRAEGDTAATSTASSSPSAEAAPVDHLAPGELLEGSEVAFGIKLPRDLRIDESFSDAVVATGRVPVHWLVRYFRPRLQEGTLREGETTATFEHVRVPGKPGLELTIHIMPVPGATRVELRDATLRSAAPLPDETTRWRKVGLTPAGQLADPTHLD